MTGIPADDHEPVNIGRQVIGDDPGYDTAEWEPSDSGLGDEADAFLGRLFTNPHGLRIAALSAEVVRDSREAG
jgi:hypothetical protein